MADRTPVLFGARRDFPDVRNDAVRITAIQAIEPLHPIEVIELVAVDHKVPASADAAYAEVHDVLGLDVDTPEDLLLAEAATPEAIHVD